MTTARLPIFAAGTTLLIALTACTAAESPPASSTSTPSESLEQVAPGLASYRDDVLLGDLWERPGLSERDRGIVTVAQMIASNQTAELAFYTDKALDDGVTPAEISEIVTHLAFYSGWENAMSAIPILHEVFSDHDVDTADLPSADPTLLPIDQAAEAARAEGVESDYGTVAPGVVEFTGSVLFQDLWLRPDLAPRDRSLVTVVALVASNQTAQIPFHLNRALDNGLSTDEAGETLTHLAFYTGWPRVFSAMPVFAEVFATR
jgi:4-carboxymuconolactone decarboxylase